MTGNDTVKSKPSNRMKLWDLISRIVPSAFFLFVVLLKCVELYGLIKHELALGNGFESWRFAADVLSRFSTICFVGLMTLLFLIRLEPIDKARRLLPRVMAVAGTFFLALLTFFPRADLSVTQTVIASLISLIGTAMSIFALAHLGRSFSMMAEARRLVTTGPYRIVRHPLYLSEALASVGVLLQFLSFSTALIFFAQLLIQLQRMKNEEAILEKAFPEYQVYKARTARVIPRLY